MGPKKARRFLLFSVALFLIVFQLAFILYAYITYEITFTKFLVKFFLKLGGGMRIFIALLAGLALYAISISLLSLGLMKYLSEEINSILVAGIGTYISYYFLKAFRPIERTTLYVFLFIAATALFIAIFSRDSRPYIRVYAALLTIVAGIILAYIGKPHALETAFGFLIIEFTIASTPLARKFGDVIEKGLRTLTSYINVTRVILGTRILFSFLGITTILTLLDVLVIMNLYISYAIYIGAILVLAGFYILAALFVYPDIVAAVATVAALKGMDKSELYTSMDFAALLYGYFFAARKLLAIFKAFLVALGVVIYILGSEKKREEEAKLGKQIAYYGVFGVADATIYFMLPVLIAISSYFSDEPDMNLASASVVASSLATLGLMSIGAAFLTLMLSLLFSALGVAILYALFEYFFYISLPLELYAALALILFPILYYALSIASISGEAYFAVERIEKNKERIERARAEAKKKLQEHGLDKSIKDYTDEDVEKFRRLIYESLGLS